MNKLHIITDLQYGSTGKGLYAAFLAESIRPEAIITAWAPNAGHTVVTETGEKLVNIALPSGIVVNPRRVILGPGSVINPDRFLQELSFYRERGFTGEVIIHSNAAVVEPHHLEEERQYGFRIGSTMKGAGAAAIQKMRRDPDIGLNVARKCDKLRIYTVSSAHYRDIIYGLDTAILEGAQGFSLSINQGFYPWTTSRECTTHQLLSDCGIPYDPNTAKWVHGVCRTFPIRVANRIGDDDTVYTSGPCYADQAEVDWSHVGVEPELTTVTKLPRRIFTFSKQQVVDAITFNGVSSVFLNFCNYTDQEQIRSIVNTIHTRTKATVNWFGYGPKISDIHGMMVIKDE